MLDEFRSTSITWDKATSRIYSPVTANASDENGRKLVVQIVNGGQVEDLTGASLHLYWETIDKLHDGLDVFKAVDLKKGEFELSYTTGMLSNKGVLNANLVLVDTAGRIVSDRFKITVTEGINDGSIQSENSFSSLTQALIDISNLEQNYAPRLNELTAQLQQTEQSVNAQLASKANQNEVRLKSEYIGLDDAKPDLLAAIQNKEGETTFNLLSIPRPESVTPQTTTFAQLSPNLFNKSALTKGYRLDLETGEIRTAAGWSVSDFLEIEAQTSYSRNPKAEVVFYDSQKMKQTVNSENTTVAVSPMLSKYVRIAIRDEYLDSFQFEKGTVSTPYAAFGHVKIKQLDIKKGETTLGENIIEPNHTTFIEVSKNLFDNSNVMAGFRLDLPTGNPKPATGWVLSDFIKVKENVDYTVPHQREICFYNFNKEHIGTSSTAGALTFKTGIGTYYVRIAIEEKYLQTFQFEEGSTSTDYAPFGAIMIPNLNITNVFGEEEKKALLDEIIKSNVKTAHPPKIDVTIRESARTPKWMDKNGAFWDSHAQDGLFKSTDYCTTWTKIADAPSDGRAYVAENLIISDTGRVIWGTNKNFFYVSDETISSWQRYDFTNGQNVANYGYHKYKNIILLANYGDLTTIVPELYASFDNGETFNVIYRDDETGNHHIHTVAYDPWGSRIYLSLGEHRQDIAYSDDEGKTWNYIYGTMGQSKFQPTQIIPTPHGILFGSDQAPDGLSYLPRSKEFTSFKPLPSDIKPLLLFDEENPHIMRYMFRRGWSNIEDGNEHTYLLSVGAPGGSTNPGRDKILSSIDGKHFDEIWIDAVDRQYSIHTISGPYPNDPEKRFFAKLTNLDFTKSYILEGKFPEYY